MPSRSLGIGVFQTLGSSAGAGLVATLGVAFLRAGILIGTQRMLRHVHASGRSWW